jgi:hypothetical protein
VQPLQFAADRCSTHPRALRSGEPLPQFREGRIGLVLDLAAQEGAMVGESTSLAARMRSRGTAAAAAKAAPQFLHKRETDTEALGNRRLGHFTSLQRVDNPITKILGVWFHTPDYARNDPDRQLQPALSI